MLACSGGLSAGLSAEGFHGVIQLCLWFPWFLVLNS